MKGKASYTLFFLVTLMVQIFLLNNLTVSVLFAPMAYVACIIMMPLDASPLKMLLTSLVIGLLMDLTMGTMGLNTLVTLPMAFFRRPILHTFAGLSSISKEEGIPSVKRLGMRFHRYAIAMIVIHSLLFYFAEWLSFDNFGTLVLRIICSTLCSLILDYIIVMLFMKRLSA